MSAPDLYQMLQAAYNNAMQVCDPIDYTSRQQQLLRCLAYYLLEKDKPQPVVEKTEEDE